MSSIDEFEEWKEQEDEQIAQLCSYWVELAPTHKLSEYQKTKLRGIVQKFPMDEIAKSMTIAIESYAREYYPDYELAWSKVFGICINRKRDRENPKLAELRRMHNILRKRLGPHGCDDETYDDEEALELLELAQRREVPLEELDFAVCSATNLTQFRNTVIETIRRSSIRIL